MLSARSAPCLQPESQLVVDCATVEAYDPGAVLWVSLRRRRFVLAAVLLSIASLAGAQTVEELLSLLDFQATLEGLHEYLNPSDDDDAAQPDFQKFLLLDGTVAAISVLDSNPDSYYVVIELVKGEWEGLEEVKNYKAVVQFQGPRFVDVFPRRVPANPPAQMIPPNSRVLVLAEAVDVILDPADDSREVFFLNGLDIRRVF